MAGKPVGTIFVELDLDQTKYSNAQKAILNSASTTALNVEKNWKIIGEKSDVMYNAMRQSINNAYEMIKNKAGTSAAEIIRAEEAKNTKIKSINEQQFGHQTTLMESVKKNWLALSAVAVGAIMGIQRIYSSAREMASMGSDIERTAETLGMTIKEFQQLSYASKQADMEQQQFTVGMRGLVGAIEEARKGTGDGAEAFKAMGISIYDSEKNIKPIKAILEDLAVKFPTYADGPEKLALAYALFGKRGGEAFLVWMNKGKEEMANNAKEADRLGLTTENYIKTLANSEQAFKTFEAGLLGIKLAAAPAVEWIGKLLSKWGDVVQIMEQNKQLTSIDSQKQEMRDMSFLKEYLEMLKKTGGSLQEIEKTEQKISDLRTKWAMADISQRDPNRWKSWLEGQKERAPAMAGKDTGKLENLPKTLKDNWETFNPVGVVKLYSDGILIATESVYAFNEAEKVRLATEERLKAIEGDLAQQMSDDMFPSIDKVNKAVEQSNQYYEEQRKKLIEIQNLVLANDWSDIAEGLRDGASDATRELTRLANVVPQAMQTTNQFMQGLGDTISSSISGAMTSMITGSQSAAEALKQIWSSIAAYVIDQITKMLMEWLLFEKTTSGGGKSGLNLMGIAANILGLGGGSPSLSSSGGGYAPAYASGGGGRNASMGGGPVQIDNSTHNMYINAVDADSFEKKYGRSVTRIMRKNYRLSGDVKNMTR